MGIDASVNRPDEVVLPLSVVEPVNLSISEDAAHYFLYREMNSSTSGIPPWKIR